MNKTSLVTRLLQFGTLPEKYIREISKYFSVVPLWNGHQNRQCVCDDGHSDKLASFRCFPGVPRRKTALRIKQGGLVSTLMMWKDVGALSSFSWSLQNKTQKRDVLDTFTPDSTASVSI